MAQVIGDVIPFAIGVALSPLPIIAVLLLLLAPVGVRGGLAFLAARLLALPVLAELGEWLRRNNAIVMAIVLLVVGAMLIGSGLSGLGG